MGNRKRKYVKNVTEKSVRTGNGREQKERIFHDQSRNKKTNKQKYEERERENEDKLFEIVNTEFLHKKN